MAPQGLTLRMRASLMAASLILGWGFPLQARADDLALHDHALVLSDQLPHLMVHIMRLDSQLELSEEQRQQLRALASEVQPRIHEGLARAARIEQDIGRAVLEEGATANALASRLSELQSLKRQLTEIQIGALNRIREILSPHQYRRVLDASRHGTNTVR